MNIYLFLLGYLVVNNTTLYVSANPLLSVADFDGDGLVTNNDISAVAQHQTNKNEPYKALYDRNADGVVDAMDVVLTTEDLDKTSTPFDIELAETFHMAEYLLDFGCLTPDEWWALGILDAGVLIKGQGSSAPTGDGLAVFTVYLLQETKYME